MADWYTQVVNSNAGKQLVKTLGLPAPAQLRRYEPGQPIIHGPVLLGAADGGRLADALTDVLGRVAADVRKDAGVDESFGAILFDATGITDTAGLRALYDFLHPVVARPLPSGRVVVFGTPPDSCDDPAAHTAQRGLEGFTRSVAKELRGGATANLVHVAEGAEQGVDSTVRFLLSGRSAYTNGQVVRIERNALEPVTPADWDRPLEGRTAVVTGASRGIGAAIARTLARDGAHVVCLDLPAQGDDLTRVANEVGGSSLQLDITGDDAPTTLVEHARERHGGLDVLVHNAGVTRDKTLKGMQPEQWDLVLEVNIRAQERLNEAVLSQEALNDNGRIVSVSSVSGIAGNRGQSNYATSKAAVIGMVHANAGRVAEAGGTINAVAPGFIETDMTAEMPFATREMGRRINSLSQGGQPVDVAEAIAWLANPASAWINGTVVRVCGQQLIGA